MPKFRHKPIVVDAFRWDGKNTTEVMRWMYPDPDPEDALIEYTTAMLELELIAPPSPGDWIVRIRGQFSPCKPDVFAETYERVEIDD